MACLLFARPFIERCNLLRSAFEWRVSPHGPPIKRHIQNRRTYRTAEPPTGTPEAGTSGHTTHYDMKGLRCHVCNKHGSSRYKGEELARSRCRLVWTSTVENADQVQHLVHAAVMYGEEGKRHRLSVT